MRVVVTGGAGFIGSHVTEELLAAGHEVAVLDNLSTGCLENVPPGAEFVEFDLTRAGLGTLMQKLRPEGVIHLAAQVSVKESVSDPLADLGSNVVGTANLLAACRESGVQSVVYASSAAVYGTPVCLPINEDHPTAPISPYGLSKLAGEWYVRVLSEQYSLRWVSLRFANVFGSRQRASGDGAVVPAFLYAMLEGRDPLIHGDGEQTRDFVYVRDVSRANLAALTGTASGIFHISTDQSTSIRELWQLSAEITGWQRPPQHAPRRPGDIDHAVLTAGRAQERLKWQPQTDLRTGLKATAEFWRTNQQTRQA